MAFTLQTGLFGGVVPFCTGCQVYGNAESNILDARRWGEGHVCPEENKPLFTLDQIVSLENVHQTRLGE